MAGTTKLVQEDFTFWTDPDRSPQMTQLRSKLAITFSAQTVLVAGGDRNWASVLAAGGAATALREQPRELPIFGLTASIQLRPVQWLCVVDLGPHK